MRGMHSPLFLPLTEKMYTPFQTSWQNMSHRKLSQSILAAFKKSSNTLKTT